MIRIMAKIAKLSINAATRKLVEKLAEEAYEAGRRDGITDVLITLEDDTDSDHSEAIELIEANF